MSNIQLVMHYIRQIMNNIFSHHRLLGCCLNIQTEVVTELHITHTRAVSEKSFHTFKQVITAVLQQTVDVHRDEELGSQWISVQVRRQCERNLQHGNQQEAAGRRFPVPPLNLTDNNWLKAGSS